MNCLGAHLVRPVIPVGSEWLHELGMDMIPAKVILEEERSKDF